MPTSSAAINVRFWGVIDPKPNCNGKKLCFLEKKLDHETWVCRTHWDDFLVKISTILDHTRTRLNLVIKDILFNFWSIVLDHL